MKAVLTDRPFCDPKWIFERKLDGDRCGARRRGGGPSRSRTGRSLDRTYPELVEALAGPGPDLLVDGEIVAFDGHQTSFERLQRRLRHRRRERARATGVAVYCTCSICSSSTARTCARCPCASARRSCVAALEFGGAIRLTAHRSARR